MRFLSNLFSSVTSISAPPQIALASTQNLSAAVASILTRRRAFADPNEVAGFINSAGAHKIPLGDIWTISRMDRILYAILPTVLPGRTLILASGTPRRRHFQAARQLLDGVVRHFDDADLAMMQTLVDPADSRQIALYQQAGFQRLARLVYLEGFSGRDGWTLPSPDWQLITYSPQQHKLFATAIAASYDQTRDCPALSGVRSVEDVIQSHKAVGEFNPADWFCLLHNSEPAGVVLLARVPASDAMELIYIGLATTARGQGIGTRLMRLALSQAAERGCSRLTTAVDASNEPAMRMYLRVGMQRTASRLALIRIVRRHLENSSTFHPQTASDSGQFV